MRTTYVHLPVSLDGCIVDHKYPADDGISPTVKCTKCSVWGHSCCNNQLGCVCSVSHPTVAAGGGSKGAGSKNDHSRYQLFNNRHYRQDLNNYANQAGLTLTFKECAEGPKTSVIWTIIAYSTSLNNT